MRESETLLRPSTEQALPTVSVTHFPVASARAPMSAPNVSHCPVSPPPSRKSELPQSISPLSDFQSKLEKIYW